ncbi:hypothetical protein [Paenibacillus sp. J2TS4]|nr:hypothetical protein [Paenibacillus sp. J2TS4]
MRLGRGLMLIGRLPKQHSNRRTQPKLQPKLPNQRLTALIQR